MCGWGKLYPDNSFLQATIPQLSSRRWIPSLSKLLTQEYLPCTFILSAEAPWSSGDECEPPWLSFFTQTQNLRASVLGSMGRENKLLDLSKLLSTLEKPTSWRESAECHNLSLWWPASCHAEQGTSYFAGLLCKFNSWRSKSFSWKNFNSFFSFWV